ncbi:hypothetical protein Bcp1_198 [Bacillus phage Bcp1]|uniref:Uncharacterized protein n=1 Tax=Bacillus phage Bcp1 TaxID=584892 RepID=X2JNH6_9CAUD|nr:hypothetical protein Bcp1_198 [Bacillus phage Bcp1]AHN66673.1 hypothetical protein Bcp1_198 [Bacillus phage Bcp1]
MEKLKEGQLTPYKDKHGRIIAIGERVELEGCEFDVIQNDFTNEIVIDGDTGQTELRMVAHMCEVIFYSELGKQTLLNEKIDIVLSNKYKDADDVLRNIWELKNKFVAKCGFRLMPNTVYLGENLVTLLNDNHPFTDRVVDVFGMSIVEVLDTDHVSLGLTLEKH